MRVIADVMECRECFQDLVLTIGSFDGVHLGHRMILDRVVAKARALGGTPAMMTLDPHPRFVFAPHNAPNLLTSLEMKAELAAASGIEVFFVLRFDAAIAAMPRELFLEDIILERCKARHLVVGHDFAFGKGAAGNYAYLKEAAPSHALTVEEAAPLILEGERVSSTLIRELILQGELDRAETFWGGNTVLWEK